MPSSRTISWDVSTQTLPDAFDRYLVGMADLYEVSGVSEYDRRNFYNVTRTTLNAAGAVGFGRSVRQTLSRGSSTLRSSDVDGLNLHVNATAVIGDCDGRPVLAAPGAVQFRDMSRPSASRLDSVDITTILVPRNLAPPSLLRREMHGLVLDPTQPAARLITAHLMALSDLAERLTDTELDAAMQALLMIAARASGVDTATVGGPDLAILQSTVRLAAAAYVERRVHAGEIPLDVGAVAHASGVSRATLYRAFEGEGGVNRYIQDRRLHHARSAIRRRQGPSPTIAEIAEAHGFASSTHFSRRFRAKYGYSPKDVEAPTVPRDVSMTTGPIRHDLLTQWLKDVRSRLTALQGG